MNKSQIEEELSKKLSDIKQSEPKKSENCEKLRKSFVKDYSSEQIIQLSLDEYVIGKGGSNKSFCYRIERELGSLGSIKSSTPNKFGIYFSNEKGYINTKKWGNSVDEAFLNIKSAICNLINPHVTKVEIQSNQLSPLFKAKILRLYHPQRFMGIYSIAHLIHYINELNIIPESNDFCSLQSA